MRRTCQRGWVKIKSADFDRSAPSLKECPNSPWPEFAFIGRSNVGKSSLINLLTERRELAKVSDMPGKTKLMNFFRINGTWTLVDLPGYGYARVSATDRADFNEAAADYIEGRPQLKVVFVLIDTRIEPQRIDLEFLAWMKETRRSFALIFTKADKLSSAKAESNVAAFMKTAFAAGVERPKFFITSIKTKAGRSDVLKFIEQALAV
jgi:GTP-binding protein